MTGETDNVTFLVITGGTIDAEAYPDPAHPPKISTMRKMSAVPEALERLGLAGRCICFSWKRKDSKLFTGEEIAALAEIIRKQRFCNVVVTHGTDRMVENARLLGRHLQGYDCRVALTGSMLPLANGAESDGWENLRFAVEQVGGFPPGVWIAFHGRRFDPERTRKNFDTYRFEAIEEGQ